jgi:hypothetical protein
MHQHSHTYTHTNASINIDTQGGLKQSLSPSLPLSYPVSRWREKKNAEKKRRRDMVAVGPNIDHTNVQQLLFIGLIIVSNKMLISTLSYHMHGWLDPRHAEYVRQN